MPINSDSDNCSSELLAASDPNFSCTSSCCKTVTKKIIRSNYFIMMISHHILHEYFKNCSMVLQWWELNGLARSDSILDSQYGLSLLVLYFCLMCSLLNNLWSSWAELHTLKIISIILILIITNPVAQQSTCSNEDNDMHCCTWQWKFKLPSHANNFLLPSWSSLFQLKIQIAVLLKDGQRSSKFLEL